MDFVGADIRSNLTKLSKTDKRTNKVGCARDPQSAMMRRRCAQILSNHCVFRLSTIERGPQPNGPSHHGTGTADQWRESSFYRRWWKRYRSQMDQVVMEGGPLLNFVCRRRDPYPQVTISLSKQSLKRGKYFYNFLF